MINVGQNLNKLRQVLLAVAVGATQWRLLDRFFGTVQQRRRNLADFGDLHG